MQQSLIGMTSHPAVALAAKTWLMYGKGKETVPIFEAHVWLILFVYFNFANNSITRSFDTLEELQSSMIG